MLYYECLGGRRKKQCESMFVEESSLQTDRVSTSISFNLRQERESTLHLHLMRYFAGFKASEIEGSSLALVHPVLQNDVTFHLCIW